MINQSFPETKTDSLMNMDHDCSICMFFFLASVVSYLCVTSNQKINTFLTYLIRKTAETSNPISSMQLQNYIGHILRWIDLGVDVMLYLLKWLFTRKLQKSYHWYDIKDEYVKTREFTLVIIFVIFPQKLKKKRDLPEFSLWIAQLDVIICGLLSRIMISGGGDFWRGTDFQRLILRIKGFDVDNPQMIWLELGPCHLQSKVYRGFNTNQNLSLDMTKSIIFLTVNERLATVCLASKLLWYP